MRRQAFIGALSVLIVLLATGCPQGLPTAGFTAQVTAGVAPLTVQFTDTSSPGDSAITAWAWNFGDGGQSTLQSPQHTYTTPGVYTVSLNVTNARGNNTSVRQNLITVADPDDLPAPAFTAAPQAGPAPLTVQFTDTSTAGMYPVTGWLWTFGDGATSTLQNPSHTYTANGLYDVRLTLTTAMGPVEVLAEDHISVSPLVNPVADFSASATTGLAPLTVQFTDLSQPGSLPITGWLWSFGDGTTSTLQNPSHTYTAAGAYTVSLQVSAAQGSNTLQRVGYIVLHHPVEPTADFSLDNPVGYAPMTVQFTDESHPGTAAITEWAWTFGDGGTSSDANPGHTYTTPGVYTVGLTVRTAYGEDTVTRAASVQVQQPQPPTADFSSQRVGLNPPIVAFTDLSTAGTSPITSRLWTFGDGATSTLAAPVHTYAAFGTYEVSLTVTTAHGSDTETRQVVVESSVPPTAAFSATPLSGTAPLEVAFTDQSTAGTSVITGWSWTFGDGQGSTAQHPTHEYTAEGTYTVSLTVFSAAGSHTLTKNSLITVEAPVVPTVRINEFVASNGSGLTDEDGNFSDWIELYNPTDETVSLEGWSLTDDASDPGKWIFPAVSIPADGYLVVFASGKNRTNPLGELHTNFALGIGGEYLGLFKSTSEPALSELSPEFPEQVRDYSYGVYLEGPEWRYFPVPTPGAANTGTAYIGFAAAPQFSHLRGFYENPLQLVLTTQTADAVIRYTLDGTNPTPTTGLVYTNPIAVTSSRPVRAATFKTGYLSSQFVTHTYVVGAPEAQKSLPAISLVVDEVTNFYGPHGIKYIKGGQYSGTDAYHVRWVPIIEHNANNYTHFQRLHYPMPYNNYPGTRRWERPLSVEVIYPGDSPAANTGVQLDAGARIHGGDSIRRKFISLKSKRHPDSPAHPMFDVFDGPDWMFHFAFKTSFRVYFRSEYGGGRLEAPLFPGDGPDRHDTLTLRGGHNDWVNPFIKDEFARRLQGDAGHLWARGNLMNLYVNGVWKGYYNVTDHVNSQLIEEWLGTENTFDVITHDYVYPDLHEMLEAQNEGADQWPPTRDGDDIKWKELINFAKNNNLALDVNYQQMASMLDMTSFIDYLIIQVYVANYDWLHTNWIAARERTDGAKWFFFLWDAERSMETTPTQDGGLNFNGFVKNGGGRTGLNGQGDDAPVAVLYQRLKPNTTFKQLFRQRINYLFAPGNALSQSNLTARFNELRNELNPMIQYTYNLRNGSSPYVTRDLMDTYILDTWIPEREAIVMQHFLNEGF